MDRFSKTIFRHRYSLMPAFFITCLVIVSQYNYLLFHTLAELAAIVIAILSFVVVWFSYPFSRNNFLMFLGSGYIWVALLDLFHTLTFKGMTLFDHLPHHDSSIQLWIVTRYFEAILLLVAPLFLRWQLRRGISTILFGIGAAIAGFLIYYDYFPTTHIDNVGLTNFKIYSEYVIIGILAVAAWHIWHSHKSIERRITWLMLGSISLTAIAEIFFTLYIGYYDLSSLAGHIFKILSYWLIFIAIIDTTLTRPFTTMARGSSTYDAIPDITIVVDKQCIIRQTNRAAIIQTGLSEDQQIGQHCHYIYHDTKVAVADCPICQQLPNIEATTDVELQLNNPQRWLVFTLTPIQVSGVINGVVQLIRDISAEKLSQKAIEYSERKFRALTENSSDIITLVNRSTQIRYISPSVINELGYRPEDIEGQTALSYVHPDDKGVTLHNFNKLFRNTEQVVFPELRFRHKNGTWIILEIVGKPYDMEGEEPLVLLNARDITSRVETQNKLHHLAHHDSLTGLPNRKLLLDRLQRAILHGKRNQTKLALLFLDLDRFKTINDSLGHNVGDELLKAMSSRLRGCIRSDDTLARLGGDEFVILLENIGNESDAAHVAQKILEDLKSPINLKDHEIFLTTSIGITLYPNDSSDINTLMKNADAAMYRAKEMGRDTYEFYTHDMTNIASQRLDMEAQLRQAVHLQQGFALHYQPRINLDDGKPLCFEALLRWTNPQNELVLPSQFIPILEETGLIIPLGEWVIRQACLQLRQWQDQGNSGLHISINLSARQFGQNNLSEKIAEILQDTGVDPKTIEFEITEGMLIGNIESACRTLESLHELGVSISVDDFGTGYSSLSYLKSLPIDALKIDRSFVMGIPDDSDSIAIINAIIALAQNLRLKLIAEGIENEEQLKFIQQHGCHEAQGFYFSKPMAPEDCEEWMKDHL